MSYRGSTSTGSLSGLSSAALAKAPTALEQLLEEINFQRTKEMRQLLKDDSGFVMLQGTTYWTDLFVRHFLFQTDRQIDCDDLLFFVRKKHIKSSSRLLPKFDTEVDVFRKASRKLPIGDPDMDWEETVYLNLIIHQFDYTLTLAICTRTSPKELQVLKRHSQKVYASPSWRRMDSKAEVEEMTYPNVCFMVDNFNEVFCDILVRDGEMVCVELVASDRDGAIQGVIFLGSIRYDALKRVYDARSSLSSKMAQRMTFGLFSNASSQRVEFVHMKGPQGKGHAEMAVTKPKGYSGAETPTSEPGYCTTDMWDSDWDSDPEEFFVYRHQRRLSDPSANINNFVRGGWKTKPADTAGSKARSENEGLDSLANGLNEIEAGDLRDDCEFCVHSISTSDASAPMETDQTIENAANSSVSVARTSSKRPPSASSIISSFFPSCKIKSKYPGRAVPCLSELNELACSTAETVLSNESEDDTACLPEIPQECKANSENQQMPESRSPHAPPKVNCVAFAETSCQKRTSRVLNAVIEEPKVESAILKDENCKIVSEETDNSSVSDDEFEDCISVGSDCTAVSSMFDVSAEELKKSESVGEEWSDAEDVFPLEDCQCNSVSSISLLKEDDQNNHKPPVGSLRENDEHKSSLLFHNTGTLPKKMPNTAQNVACSSEPLTFHGNLDHLYFPPEQTISKQQFITQISKEIQPESSWEAEEETAMSISKYPLNQKNTTDKPECSNFMRRKAGKQECSHGIDMNRICLPCLGYTEDELWERSYKSSTLKSDSEKANASEDISQNGTSCEKKGIQQRRILHDEKTTINKPCPLHRPLAPLLDGLKNGPAEGTNVRPKPHPRSHTLPHRRNSQANARRNREVTPPHKVASDGTAIYYWCDVPGGQMYEPRNELDDGAYNPLWTMRGFTQTFHFWKENKRAQSVPLNAFLTYITLPWWSIVKDILDHRESPILTF